MRTGGLIILAVVMLVVASAVVAEDRSDTAAQRGAITIRTPDQAFERALIFTGFSEADGLNREQVRNSIHLIDYVDTLTPFLHDSTNGRQVWSVTFDDLVWDIKKAYEGLKDQHHKRVEVIIDQETGRLFKIRAVTIGNEPDDSCCRKPPGQSAEWQTGGKFPYHGFPPSDPEVTFRMALESTMDSPLLAREILALYVMCSSSGGEPHAVWDIHMYGLPPVPRKIPRVPPVTGEHWRNLVDVETGGFGGRTNSPQ